MFQKILIANRGEIAVRIARTVREMGIRSVAVYSEADRGSLHVRMADEAHPIGPAAAAESYLRIERILEVAQRAKVRCDSPGLRFSLGEPSFPRSLRTSRHRVHRSSGERHALDGEQARGPCRHAERRRAHRARRSRFFRRQKRGQLQRASATR